MENEINFELFTTKLDRKLTEAIRIHCLVHKPKIKIREFVANALEKALKETKKGK